MAGIHCATSSILREIVKLQAQQTCLPPAFLLPAFAKQQKTPFSTSSPVSARARKDRNTRRGMSPLKRTGFNKMFRLSVKLEDLPKPVLDPAHRTQVQTDDDHGLWLFFNEARASLMTPEALNQHGRAWTVPELRRKDYDDLWKLWWICAHEKNRVKTCDAERARLKYGYGNYEANARLDEINKTQKAIKIALTERWYSFESAREMAMSDPEINLYANPANGEKVFNRVEEQTAEHADDQLPEVADEYASLYPMIDEPSPVDSEEQQRLQRQRAKQLIQTKGSSEVWYRKLEEAR